MYYAATRIVFILTIVMFVGAASALEVCNYSNQTVSCAGGRNDQQARTYISEGWIRVQPGVCAHPAGQSLYCKGDQGGMWDDNYARHLCVIDGERFMLYSANDSNECNRRGGRMVGFMYNGSENYTLRP